MQRLLALIKTVPQIGLLQSPTFNAAYQCFSTLQNNVLTTSLLSTSTPLVNLVCGFKVKGHCRRRCAHCYFVVRQERLYVICPKFPRHKQMAMKAKPHNTWLLTHASQSKVRPW